MQKFLAVSEEVLTVYREKVNDEGCHEGDLRVRLDAVDSEDKEGTISQTQHTKGEERDDEDDWIFTGCYRTQRLAVSTKRPEAERTMRTYMGAYTCQFVPPIGSPSYMFDTPDLEDLRVI